MENLLAGRGHHRHRRTGAAPIAPDAALGAMRGDVSRPREATPRGRVLYGAGVADLLSAPGRYGDIRRVAQLQPGRAAADRYTVSDTIPFGDPERAEWVAAVHLLALVSAVLLTVLVVVGV